MIDCVFSIDYEIYGNGQGSLAELIYDPTERLREIFVRANVPFVPFVEVAELDVIERHRTDGASCLVRRQIAELRREGSIPALHLHPQWYNARFDAGEWILDYDEYNLCTLPIRRIEEIVDRALAYLRDVLADPGFTPVAFRAGNWLFQPTNPAADVLASRGIKIDSSVFKGGVRHEHGLDYRQANRNGYYWRFRERADVADESGTFLELPIYTQMVPFWRMASSKRVSFEGKGFARGSMKKRFFRARDVLRMWHPLKLDFCRMTLDELTGTIDEVVREDCQAPSLYRPIVAIGHTKELVDLETIASFLQYLSHSGIRVCTFDDIYARCH